MNRRVADVFRLFSWKQVLRMKVAGHLRALNNRSSMRHAVALREFRWLVPSAGIAASKGVLTFDFPVEGKLRHFSLRSESSDIQVFLQIIRDGEYREAVRMMEQNLDAPRIVDAGANIGLTSLYFKSVFPNARILAMEPESGNFQSLTATIASNGLTDVIPVQKALWPTETDVMPDRTFRDGGAWSFAVRPDNQTAGARIPAVTLRTLLDTHRWQAVDLLKIDIEGSEAPLIRDPDTLNVIAERASLLCMEVHEEVISRDEVRRALASVGMQAATSGETLVAWKR